MGSFYTSHTLRGPSQLEVLEWLKDRSAYVSITERAFTTVLDEGSDSQDGVQLADLSARMSINFKCPVLAVLNHDDDILYFILYENGVKMDEYNSNPSYFGDESLGFEPSGGNAARLAAAFGAANVDTIETVLRSSDYVFETERHQELAIALGIPDFAVGIGYQYAKSGDISPSIPNGSIHTKDGNPE